MVRFDGLHAIPWNPPRRDNLAGRAIYSLLVAKNGTLWIGTKGLASWKDGKLTQYPELTDQFVIALREDREGTIWAGGMKRPNGRLCAIRDGEIHCYGDDGRLGIGVFALYEDANSNRWAGVSNGLWRWKPGPPMFYSLPGERNGVQAISEDVDGALLVGWKGGIYRFNNGKTDMYSLPGISGHLDVLKIVRDRNSGLWIAATWNHGLLHVHDGRTDVFSASEGLSSDSVGNIFEDREGTVWVCTIDGLDRFRDFAAATFTAKQGLSNSVVGSISADKSGSVWLGTYGGLNQWSHGQITIPGTGGTRRDGMLNGFPPESLLEDNHGRIWISTSHQLGYLEAGHFTSIKGVPGGPVLSIAQDITGNLWVINEEAGLFRISPHKDVRQFQWSELGHKDHASVLAADPTQGGLWIGFFSGGISYFSDGHIRASYTTANGLGPGRISDFQFDQEGNLWVSTEGGLSRLKQNRLATLASKNGLPCDKVHWSIEGNDHSFWLYTACGLVRIERSQLDAWATAVDKGQGAPPTVQVTVFDTSDGVRSLSDPGHYHPQVAKTADGKLWFLPWDGVSVIDPNHLTFNNIPPPVHIENITADDKPVEISNGFHLPTGVRHLDIDYTALSLVVPEKVRFRVKLEGEDKDWRELVNVRHVEYTNLPPKHYKFRVLACNNSGVWNEEGATLDFVIPPAWYQTNWFRAACIGLFLAMIWGLHELRVRQLAHEFNMGLEQRVAERTRIARDLHDTLLQSFQALLPLFQVGIKKLPESAVDSRKTLQLALDRASEAIGEGRDAIKGLRMSTTEKNDLAMAIRTIGEEFAAGENGQNSISFQLLVEGTPRNLHPILRDEVYRLATEALRNSFRHADAKNVEVEIRYDEKYFRLRVRDDGKGIPSDVLSRDGREGHYGLPGMRERAKLVGGKLTIWTELDSGTEVELVIPGAKAYVKSARPFWYFGKRSSAETDEKETIERE